MFFIQLVYKFTFDFELLDFSSIFSIFSKKSVFFSVCISM